MPRIPLGIAVSLFLAGACATGEDRKLFEFLAHRIASAVAEAPSPAALEAPGALRLLSMSNVILSIEQRQLRKGLPQFKAGDTVKVHFRVIEGQRSRIQVFEGIVIARKRAGVSETFTVRKISSGIGVERVFALHSPNVAKVERVRQGHVRRGKLYYMRDLTGKSARIKEVLAGGDDKKHQEST